MRSEAVKKTALWAVFRPTVRARKREDVDFREAEIVNPCLSATRVHAPTRGVFRFWGRQKRRCDKSQRLATSFVERLASCQRSFPRLRSTHLQIQHSRSLH